MRRSTHRFVFLFLIFETSYAETVTVSLLATTDLHGNIYPTDYYTGRPAQRGLAKIATLVREARAGNPHSILVDCGDTIQGTPLESVYQTLVRSGRAPLNLSIRPELFRQDPMMLAMNALGYDAMVVGNHEFNFGVENLEKARSDARFPWISANVEVSSKGHTKPFAPYMVKEVAGVKVAVIGITTAAVPTWEKPENIGNYRFTDGTNAVRRVVHDLRNTVRPDVIVVAAHSGLGRDLATGAPTDFGGDVVYNIASSVPELDAIVFGHSHQELAGHRVGNVLLAQPKNWGISLARLDFVLERAAGGSWSVQGKSSRLTPVLAETAADAEILAMARPYHELAEQYLNTPVADSKQELNAALGRIEDTALVDAIHQVQLHYAQADVSFTALFNPRVRVPKGMVTVRQIAALYIYDNQLYAIEASGKMLKEALENAARYFLTCEGARCAQLPLVNSRVLGFNFDMAEGVEYEIDLNRPEGDRIQKLSYRGRRLEVDQKLRLAVNNYRAAGSAGYSMFRGAKILWRSSEEIRDLIVEYYIQHKLLPVKPSDNWRIMPLAARETLARQAQEEARRSHLY